MKLRFLFVISGLLVLSQWGCKKDSSPNWIYCQECGADQWVGTYNGKGDYYNGKDVKQYLQLETQLEIKQISGNTLQMNISVSDHFQTSFSTSKDDNQYYINIPGSTRSLYLVLAQSGNQSRITGTAKTYRSTVDTLIIDHSVSFEVIKSEK